MFRIVSLLTALLFVLGNVHAQSNQLWPKAIPANGATIKIYQPQIENYSGNQLRARGAFSILKKDQTDPVFGALWVDAMLETNRANRTAVLEKIKVNEIRFAGDSNAAEVDALKSLLEREIPKWDMVISLDELESSIEGDQQTDSTAPTNLSTTPPKILYSDKPATLVLIEGEPKLKENQEMGVEMVMNTPFTIAKIKTVYYLSGNERWYTAQNIQGPWTYTRSIPDVLEKLNKAILETDKKEEEKQVKDSGNAVIPEIIVSSVPAELIQSNGEPDMATIPGTDLLYMTNTNNDVFMQIKTQQYYVLLSGRWYAAPSLRGPWTYTASDKLPADFAKIPVGSPKDNVLANVAGTDQAQDAVMDAQIPQTAKVDRNTATTKVTYNGTPEFVPIEGTNLKYAANTNSTVLFSEKKYYSVENGIWFEATTANGPWKVSVSRPAEVNKIPPTVPVYNVKYVYVYEATPQYVYVGYTPGYMGNYVYGGTVIYGTGYYYNPWYGPYYYPRPVTYGFGMAYNPYWGWSIGFRYSAGWFGYPYWGGYHGGYWGPPMYRPPYYHHPGYPPHYRPPYYPRPGYRPPVATPYRGGYNARPVNTNVYRNNRGVTTNDRIRPMPVARPGSNPSIRPVTGPGGSPNPATRPAPGNPSNRLPGQDGRPTTSLPAVRPTQPTTDQKGNVFQRDANGWQERNGGNWQNVNPNRQAEINRLNQQQQMRDRGNMRTNNFNQPSRPAPSPRPMPSGGAPRGRR